MKHTVSLTLCTKDTPERHAAFRILSGLAQEIQYKFEGCTLSAYEIKDDEERSPGDEWYDDYTLLKVVHAMREAGISDQQAEDAITAMQNAGILFRERA